jgi:hypothetical protein
VGARAVIRRWIWIFVLLAAIARIASRGYMESYRAAERAENLRHWEQQQRLEEFQRQIDGAGVRDHAWQQQIQDLVGRRP